MARGASTWVLRAARFDASAVLDISVAQVWALKIYVLLAARRWHRLTFQFYMVRQPVFRNGVGRPF